MTLWLIYQNFIEILYLFLGDDCFIQDISYKGNDCFGDCDLQPDSWRRESAYLCQLLCQEIDQCLEFTWISPGSEGSWINGRNRCCLKNETSSKPEVSPGRVSGPKFCDEYFPYVDPLSIEGGTYPTSSLNTKIIILEHTSSI